MWVKYGIAFVLLTIIGCKEIAAGNIYLPDVTKRSDHLDIPLNSEGIGVSTLFVTDAASYHIVKMKGQERPHYHDRHDLLATVIKGKSRIHFEDRVVEVTPGDVVFIPKGSYHWVENIYDGVSEIFVTFTPAFDKKDRRFVDNY